MSSRPRFTAGRAHSPVDDIAWFSDYTESAYRIARRRIRTRTGVALAAVALTLVAIGYLVLTDLLAMPIGL